MSNRLGIGTQNSDRVTLISDATWEEFANLTLPSTLIIFSQWSNDNKAIAFQISLAIL